MYPQLKCHKRMAKKFSKQNDNDKDKEETWKEGKKKETGKQKYG